MKKLLTMCAFAAMLFGLTGCTDDDGGGYRTYQVAIELVAPSVATSLEGVAVTATGSTGTQHTAATDAAGVALFDLPEDIYDFAASLMTSEEGLAYVVNYTLTATISGKGYQQGTPIAVALQPAVSQGAQQLLVKEYYFGGCPKDDGSGNFSQGAYVTLYNNSAVEARVKNLGLGMANPSNANANNANYKEGKLFYEGAGYTPSWQGVWYYPAELVVAPYGSVTIAISSAIDNTQTYSQAVDLSRADYACYDPDAAFTSNMHTAHYPTPSESIPSSNWFRLAFIAMGNAWAMSNSSPAFFIFKAGDTDLNAYVTDAANQIYPGGSATGSAAQICVKIKNEWILDAVEIWQSGKEDKSKYRFGAEINAGHLLFTNAQGYTAYRNVDKEATEALEENAGLLVYNYALGTEQGGAASTDPSMIDAEASIANGAHILFKDTNHTGNDFHQRAKSALRP